MKKINVYNSPYHWKYVGFDKYTYLYPLKIVEKYLEKGFLGLDTGCGDCKSTSILAQKLKSVCGIDNQIVPLQYCKKLLNAKNLSLIRADCLRLPFRNSTFDVGFLFDVIEHLPFNQLDFLFDEVKRVIKSDGLIVVTTPNRRNTILRKQRISQKHYFELSYKEILRLLDHHNLKVLDFKGIYPRPYFRKLHKHIRKRRYLYAPLIGLGKWFPWLCDTFVVVSQKNAKYSISPKEKKNLLQK